MRRLASTAVLLAVACQVAWLAPLPAQSPRAPQTSGTAAQRQVAQIYLDAQRIASREDAERLLALCRQVDRNALIPRHAAYLDELHAWILNKQGELLVELAEQKFAAGMADQAGRLEAEALRAFDQAVRVRPEFWRARHNRGVSLAMAGKLDEAIEDFSLAIQQQPTYKNSWFNRAELHMQMGRYAEAEADYSQVLQLDPNDAAAYAGRAHSRYELRKFDQALADYNAQLRLTPDDPQAYLQRADLHAQLGFWDKAAQDYRDAIRLDNTLAEAYRNAAWMMATCPDPRFRNPDLAIKAAERALELESEPDYRSLDALAAALASAGRFSEASQMLREAIGLAPPDSSADMKVRLASYEQQRPFVEGRD